MKTNWYRINQQMLSSKLAYLFEYGKEGAHKPHLVLFYVSIGLDPFQAGIISGLRLIGGVLGAPFWGWIADRTHYHRSIAILLCILSATANIAQPFIAMKMGDHNKNSCPRIANETSNITVPQGSYYYSNSQRYQNKNPSTEKHSRMFFTLLGVSTFACFFDGSTGGFVDSGVLRNILNSPISTNIGQQRYSGPPGVGIAAFISGVFIDYFPHISMSCYSGIWFNYVLTCCGLAIVFNFLLRRKQFRPQHTLYRPQQVQKNQGQQGTDQPTQEEEKQLKDDVSLNINSILLTYMKKPSTHVFLGFVIFNGMAVAPEYGFSFLFLDEIKASNLIVGVSMFVNGLSGALGFVASPRLIKMLGGSLNAMGVSCMCWTIRYIGLAYMNKPYQFLLLCLLNGLTCSLCVTAYVEYIKNNFPPEIFTTVCGITSSLYNSGGYMLASLLAGAGYKMYGAHKLFVVCGIVCCGASLLTFVYEFLQKCISSRREDSTGDIVRVIRVTSVDNQCFKNESFENY